MSEPLNSSPVQSSCTNQLLALKELPSAALKAEARLIDPGVPMMLARHRSATRVFGVNVGATISWLDELSPGRGWGALRGKLGGELSDIYRVDAWTARGGVSELVLTQRFLDQARASYGALAQLSGS